MKESKYYKLHIFQPGKHRSASGHVCEMSEDDLRRTAEVFVSNHRVPLCLGHSSFKHHDVVPSLGWFRDVKMDSDGKLYGLLEATPAGANLLDNGYYENFSASFYAPDSPLNPKPGTWTLRHVAALGGEPPALKELDPMLEVLPEDFSEVQNFNQWYEFKESDEKDFVSFSDSSKLLPDSYDFKSFRKFGQKLNCKTGQKQCGGRCIPSNWKCTFGKKESKFIPGTRKPFQKKSFYKSSQPKLQEKVLQTPKKDFVPKEEWLKNKKEEDAKKKEDKTAKNLTLGSLKGIAAATVSIAAVYAGEKAFPDNKSAKAAVNILGNVAAQQFVVADNASISDRLKMAAVSGLEGTVEESIKIQLEGNAYASTMAKASSGIISTMLTDSGLIDLKYDSYANKFYKASTTLNSAIQDTKKWTKEKEKTQSMEETLRREMEDIATDATKGAYAKARSAEASASKAASESSRMRKSLMDLLEWIRDNPDTRSAEEKLNIIIEQLREREKRGEFSEKMKYPNSQIDITFTAGEVKALLLPYALCILKSLNAYDEKDVKKALAKKVESGNPHLDAIFSELEKAPGVLKHNVSNQELAEALFGPERLSKDFSETDETPTNSPRKRVRRKKSSDQNFSEKKQEKINNSPRKLKIDALLDDAIAQAEQNFSERDSGKKSNAQGKNKRGRKRRVNRSRNFQEINHRNRIARQSPRSQNNLDFKESEEYQSLQRELVEARTAKRRLEVENFAEGLYRDGYLTEGIARKNDLVNFMLGLESSKSSFDFGEGSAVSDPYNFMSNLLQNIEPMVSFSEVATKEDSIIKQPRFEDGYDISSQKMDYQINLLMQSDPNLTYEQAWIKVAGRRM